MQCEMGGRYIDTARVPIASVFHHRSRHTAYFTLTDCGQFHICIRNADVSSQLLSIPS